MARPNLSAEPSAMVRPSLSAEQILALLAADGPHWEDSDMTQMMMIVFHQT